MEKTVEKMVDMTEASKIVGCHYTTIWSWIVKKKYLKATVERSEKAPFGKKYMINLAELKKVAAEHPINKKVIGKHFKKSVKHKLGATLGIRFPEMTAIMERQLVTLSSIDESLQTIKAALGIK